MFGPSHYIPALKLKRGEKAAIQQLHPSIIKHLTPLFEVVEMNGSKTIDEHLATAFSDFKNTVSRLKRYFIDVREIAPAGKSGAEKSYRLALEAAAPFCPVTRLDQPTQLEAALAVAKAGIALRITRREFEEKDIPKEILSFQKTSKHNPESVDLIVDAGAVELMVEVGISSMVQQFLDAIPYPKKWRSLTVISSSFPKTMSVVDRHSHKEVTRENWLAWNNAFFAVREKLPRLPTFGDWGIQHPSGVEGFNPKTMAASATVRYARDQSWLLIKGESTKKALPSDQFPKLASRLVEAPLKKMFDGPSHCMGCKATMDAATGAPGLGGAEAWRRIGTVHHITKTVEQIQALPWP